MIAALRFSAKRMGFSRGVFLDASNCSDFLKTFDCVLADCDGVLWRGDSAIPNAPKVMQKFAEAGKKLFYVTNNSTKSRAAYLKKFHQLGFPASTENIYGTSTIVAAYLKSINFRKKAYCIGTTGLKDELDAAGIQHVGFGPDVSSHDSHLEMVKDVVLEEDVGAVVVGFDPHFSYLKMLKGATYLNKGETLFLATNTDARFPHGSNGIIMPGTGTFVSAMETVSQRKPLIFGKPNSNMFDAIKSEHGIDPARTIMIGDNCHTDILLGKNCGLRTLLVLTGVTSEDDLDNFRRSKNESHLLPDFFINSLGDLLHLM
ncbi:unnamed protein product [Notodromas monacha]|uniref:Phosphoglycolate phosphatase n=1 Tax=Notodromas monacha TaxID=399045 RepID=A0A7R9BI39_9CRUS|nr:unnamed protein product [Notodromas monacha]CAG0914321.1 unnamed protein product [Notodromas monacha]